MFLDELSLQARGGQGGDGCVHFARRKYEPFGGPDGGDGGHGGDVVMLGSRKVDSLDHLRQQRLCGAKGGQGAGKLQHGARGTDCELVVPPGTLALQLPGKSERGFVAASGERVLLARGGRGGKGNPHFATGGRRAPKQAESGRPGQQAEYLLTYRLYADTVVVEPRVPGPTTLLPWMLERPPADVDWPLYQHKPRWVRVVHDYRAYDVAYLPAELSDDIRLDIPFLHHCYWAESIVLNLVALEELAAECWPALHSRLTALSLRRCQRITVIAMTELFAGWQLETEGGAAAEVNCVAAASADDTIAVFRSQLSGGTVS